MSTVSTAVIVWSEIGNSFENKIKQYLYDSLWNVPLSRCHKKKERQRHTIKPNLRKLLYHLGFTISTWKRRKKMSHKKKNIAAEKKNAQIHP